MTAHFIHIKRKGIKTLEFFCSVITLDEKGLKKETDTT